MTEKGTGTPMEFVNVLVYDTATQKLVKGSVSDANGRFSVDDLPFGRPLQATFSSMGYATLTGKVFLLSAQHPAQQANDIKLETTAKLLDAVTITGQKRTIEYSLDRKVVNVEQSLVSEGGTAVDVLQNVPSINVDDEGNISMKGSESVTVLIDGRPASFSGLGLDQLSAANIANIEIISNPSAKYNPEGTSGIINIITKERKDTEINGNVYASTSTANRHSLGANLSFGLKKVTLFTNVDLNYRNRESVRSSWRISERGGNPDTAAYGSDNMQKEISGPSTGKHDGLGGKVQAGADFRINPNNTLLISGTFEGWNNHRNNAYNESRTFSYINDLPFEEHDILLMGTSSSSAENRLGGQAALSYKHKFAKPQEELTFDATVNYHTPDESSNNYQKIINIYPADTTVTTQTVNNRRRNLSFDAQLNYIHPFNEKLSLEVGYQAKLQAQATRSLYDSRLNQYQDTSIDFDYISHNHGIYANLMGKFGNFSFQVGGRMEGDFMTADKRTERGDTSFSYTRFRFYPAVHLSYKIGKMQEIQLSYSRRVNRPGPWNLDPYVDYSNYPSSIRYGNPDLKPQDIHSLELNYSLFVKNSSIFVTVYYRHMTDLIRRYQFESIDDISGEVLMNSTFRNYAKGNTYGVDIAYEQQLLKWWRMGLTGSLYQNNTRDKGADASTSTEGLSYNVRFNTTMNLPLAFTLQFTCRYNGPSYWAQTKFDWNVSGEIALRKSFFQKRLNVGLRVSDLFHTQRWNSTVTGEGFVSQRKSRAKNSTALYITASYKINKGFQERNRNRGGGNEDSMDMYEM
ncbi:MAG: TonB-dependent receptor [Bacteroidales bacterium]|nr:TonB-dependent receptor [Bacteroidales bacterium]